MCQPVSVRKCLSNMGKYSTHWCHDDTDRAISYFVHAKEVLVLFFLQYRTANIGQILIGLASPVCMSASPAISATWFPANQRTTSTAIGTVAVTFGSAFSFLIGPSIVTEVKATNNTE